jgi:hypothetical protein
VKIDPPFIYKGEIQARLFKKRVRETRLYMTYSGLNRSQSLDIVGKYLAKRAYKYYEQEVLSKRMKLTWGQFFAGLFDYIFPPGFLTQQRDRFDECSQHGRTLQDFLQNLRDLANTSGDLEDKDIVLAFWRRCESYLRFELTRDGYSADSITLQVIPTIFGNPIGHRQFRHLANPIRTTEPRSHFCTPGSLTRYDCGCPLNETTHQR